MHTTHTFILVAASALTASAGVIPRDEPTAVWQATNFNWGSSPGGTAGNLDLVGEEGYIAGAPAFEARCSPIMVQRGWTPCRAPDGGELPATERVEIIWPSGPELGRFYFGAAHIFLNADGEWVNATAVTDIETPEPQGNAAFDFPVVCAEVLDGEPPRPE